MSTAGLDLTRRVVDERCATAARLTRAGWSAQRISDQLGVHKRTIVRYRRRTRAELDQASAATA